MTPVSLRRRIVRRILFAGMTIGVASSIATDCDPAVRSRLFGGVQDLATSFLDAFFIKLQQTDDRPPVTVDGKPARSHTPSA